MDYMERYRQWCTSPVFSGETKEELQAVRNQEDKIKDRFYKELEFGTGGLRGIMGAGTNRMNIYTVGKATQGLADYIKSQGGCERGVAIAYDSRHKSEEFARHTALCLNANGISAFLFSKLTPTPILSFAVRKLSCIAGIVITASHNPPEYNGYKVYQEDGAQITHPKDEEIIQCVNQVKEYDLIKGMTEEEAQKKGLFHLIGPELEEQYLDEIEKCVLSPEAVKKAAKDIKIVYTPLHGTGNLPVRHILSRLGFSQVFVVKQQMEPDGDFKTVDYPNPEAGKAFQMALKLAEEVRADLVLATDPDGDRLGVYVRDEKTEEYRSFTGNMTGILICSYLLSRRKELGILPEDGAIVKTIVTTRMAEPVAKKYGLRLVEVLTGFKYIGQQMRLFEEHHGPDYQFGFEESCGCLVESCVRDKDAVSAAMTICEAAAYYRTRGSSVWEELKKLYQAFGFYKESLESVTLKGEGGTARIKAIMESVRRNPPAAVGGFQVLQMEDYERGTVLEMETGNLSALSLPKSNVLRFLLNGEAWFCIRPSGTEPKIKYYFGVKGLSFEDSKEKLKRLKKGVFDLF